MTPPATTADANGRLWGQSAQDWAEIQEHMCRPVYEEALDRLSVGRGTHYLDAGCGSGLAAQLASDYGARVSGLDAAENLLAIARARVPQGDFRQAPLEQMPFAGASFEAVTGFNSFQYAASPVAALAEAKRVTTPGGLVLIMTWGNPAGMEAASLVAALKPLLPSPPSGVTFALSDESALKALATSANLAPIDIFDVDSPWRYANLDEALRGLRSSGVAARAIEHTSAESVDAAHTTALTPFRQLDGSYLIGATFRCLIARA